MPINEGKQNGLLARYVSDQGVTGDVGATDLAHPPPTGIWTIDPAESSISLAWPKLRLGSITARLHCVGVIHLDALPPVGVVRFEQPSGLPVLTIALDPASVETHDADLDAKLRSPKGFDAQRHRWWTLRSEGLEILANGAWRVMATLTTNGNPGQVELHVELHLEVDPATSSADWLVLRGRGLLDRRAFGIGAPVSTFSSQIRLDVAVRARRVGPHPHPEKKGEHMHNQHAGLSQLLTEQRITQRQEQAAQARLAQSAGRPRRRRRRWLTRRWWQLARRPGAATPPAVGHPHHVR
jgi:polyisoprenoid-binding protein YceI